MSSTRKELLIASSIILTSWHGSRNWDRSHTTQRIAVCSCRSVLEAPRMDPQSWPAEPQYYKQKTHITCVHRSEQQVRLESHKTAIKLHRSAQENKTQECDGGHCVLCRSQEWWRFMVIPVVETSGSQECVGGTCKFLYFSSKPGLIWILEMIRRTLCVTRYTERAS
jgi:hypothetical protein